MHVKNHGKRRGGSAPMKRQACRTQLIEIVYCNASDRFSIIYLRIIVPTDCLNDILCRICKVCTSFFFFFKSKLALSKLLSDGTIRKKMIVTKVESGRWKVENKCNVHRDRYFLVDYILFWSYFGDEAIMNQI